MVRKKEHDYIRIEKDIKSGKIPGLVLLQGTEEYLVSHYGQVLSKKFIDPAAESMDLVTLHRDKITLQAVIENLETLPILSERKVVFLPDFIDGKGNLPKAFDDNGKSLERLEKYIKETLEDPHNAESMLLLLTAAKQKDERSSKKAMTAKLFKMAAAAGKVYEFGTLEGNQVRAFIEKRFRGAHKQCHPSVISFIIEESGYRSKNVEYGLFNLENDLRKIIAYSGERDEITKADVAAVITVNPENNVFTMIEAIGRNRKSDAFAMLRNLMEDGVSEFQLLSLITKELELMLIVSEMNESGMNIDTIKTVLKEQRIHEYRVKKALEGGRRFGSKKLKKMLLSAYQVEVNVKEGLMPFNLAIEFFIAGI